MGRLIDTDRLKEVFSKNVVDGNAYFDLIDAQPTVEAISKADVVVILDKIRAEITDCLKALDEIEKSGFNIYLPNEISGRRLTYQQCLSFIDKYNAESEVAANDT